MQIETAAIASLSLMPAEIVPINYTERDLDVVRHLIAENGQRVPVLVQRATGRVFWGGDIWLQMRAMGKSEIAVVYHDVDDREAARIAIRLRRAGELAEWSEKELAEILAQMEDPETMGFSDEEFEELLATVSTPKAEPTGADPGPMEPSKLTELKAKWNTMSGQLWLIESKSQPGRHHRLLIGDSTNADDVRRLMNGERSKLFSTDPPYLVNYDGTNHPGTAKNKDWSETYDDWDGGDQGEQFYHAFISTAIREAITDHAAWYCWHASARQSMLERIWKEHGAFMHQQIIWTKTRPVLTRSWYRWAHEPCMFGWIKGNKPARYANDVPSTQWEAEQEILVGEETLHPTPKPTKLFEIPMLQHTQVSDICYEPFSGSGAQHAAGEKLGRLVYGMEKEPAYVAGILERLSKMGLKVMLEMVDQPAVS